MKTLIALLALVAPALVSAAQWQDVASVREAAESLARERFATNGQELVVRASLDPRLQLPACAQKLSARVQNTGGAALTAAVSCAQPSTWTLYVPVQVSRIAQVLVLNRAVMAGEVLSADAVSLRRQEIADLGYGFITQPDRVIGQTARRALAAGAVLGLADLAAPNLVKRGQPVTLVSRAGAITVRVDGKALGDGAAGDYISVQNLNSRRVVRGKVRSQGEVDVDS